jgi:protein dithiol oxidoreductase (disulfide-forming)
MNPFRRKVLASMGYGTLALAAAPVFAQDKGPRAGADYIVLSPPLPPESKTRVEVIEFFWYGCPHCYAFEPIIEPWIKKLSPEVLFHRIPAVFNDSWVPHAKLYYSLEILGEVDRLHGVIFDTIHKDHQILATESAIADFLEKNGVPRKKFTEAFESFSVQSKVQRSIQLQSAYKLDGVPAMGVDGRYVTNNVLVGGRHEAVLPVVDYLIGEARKLHKLPKT